MTVEPTELLDPSGLEHELLRLVRDHLLDGATKLRIGQPLRIDEGRKEMDFDKRQQWWQKLEAVLHEDQPYTFIRVPPWCRFVSTRFSNVNPYPKGLQADEYFLSGTGSTPSPGN